MAYEDDYRDTIKRKFQEILNESNNDGLANTPKEVIAAVHDAVCEAFDKGDIADAEGAAKLALSYLISNTQISLSEAVHETHEYKEYMKKVNELMDLFAKQETDINVDDLISNAERAARETEVMSWDQIEAMLEHDKILAAIKAKAAMEETGIPLAIDRTAPTSQPKGQSPLIRHEAPMDMTMEMSMRNLEPIVQAQEEADDDATETATYRIIVSAKKKGLCAQAFVPISAESHLAISAGLCTNSYTRLASLTPIDAMTASMVYKSMQIWMEEDQT